MRGNGFHRWRRTVCTKLEDVGVPELETARLVGHSLQTMSYGLYSGGMSLVQLRETVEKIRYKELKL